ncbi:MAG: hypothetical protein AB3N11_05105 [Arenibacterium sp.]
MPLIKVTSTDGLQNDERKTFRSENVELLALSSAAGTTQFVQVHLSGGFSETLNVTTRAEAETLFTRIEGEL